MFEVTVYATRSCPYCRAARQLLGEKNIPFTEIDVRLVHRRREMVDRSGRRTVPQIFFGDRHVGGYDDLAQLEDDGALTEALTKRRWDE